MKKFEQSTSTEITVNDALATMHGILGMISQLGRNDSEVSTAHALLAQVQAGELLPVDGVVAMQALLDNKQAH